MKNRIFHHYCLDIGGTGTRGALFDKAGKELARAEANAGALSLGAQQSYSAIIQVWSSICKLCNRDPGNTVGVKITAGIAGYGLPGRSNELKKLLNEFQEIQITSDGYGALLAATGGAPGALIAIGTGVGALKLDADNKTQAVSSWGFPAGDAGSGAWIGLKLFADFLKVLDGIVLTLQPAQQTVKQVFSVSGTTAAQIMAWQIRAKPKDFAQLVPLVIAGAKRGDIYCHELLSEAATEITRVAIALQSPNKNCVYLSGGLGAALLPYCIEQPAKINWKLSNADPIEGIYLLARGHAPEQDLLTRPGLVGRP